MDTLTQQSLDRPPPSQHAGAKKFTTIQQLRGIIAILVILPHIIVTVIPTSQTLLLDTIGIDTFFVIGGFIMLYVSRNDFGQRAAVGNYYARRIARIVPLYWICTGLFVAIHQFGNPPLTVKLHEVLGSLAFIPYGYRPAGDEFRPIFSAGWFLDYLMFFDVIFGLFLFLPRRAGVIGIVATLVLLAVSGVLRFESSVLEVWTKPVALKFAAGVALGYLFVYRAKFGLTLKIGPPLVWFVALFALGFGCTYVGIDGRSALDWRPIHGLISVTIVAIAVFSLEPKRSSAIAKALHTLGDASYSLYLSHPLVLLVAYKLWRIAGLGPSLWAFGFVIFPVILVTGLLVYRYFEAPATARLIAWWNTRRSWIDPIGSR